MHAFRSLASVVAVGAFSAAIACSSSSSSSSSSGSSSPPLKCTRGGTIGYCFCDRVNETNPGGTVSDEMPCTEAAVGAPARCCAAKEFVAGGAGGCTCTAALCSSFMGADGPVCSCEYGTPRETTATSCKPATNKECCLDVSRCDCGTAKGTCTGTVVAECTTAMLSNTCMIGENTLNQSIASCRN